jgi:hypothetical protein
MLGVALEGEVAEVAVGVEGAQILGEHLHQKVLGSAALARGVELPVALGLEPERDELQGSRVEPAALHLARKVRVADVRPLPGGDDRDDLAWHLPSHRRPEGDLALGAEDPAADGIRLERQHDEVERSREVHVGQVGLVALPWAGRATRPRVVWRQAQPRAVGRLTAGASLARRSMS